jgi:hypothetical protein
MKNLPLKSLGKLLRLAENNANKRAEDIRPVEEKLEEHIRDITAQLNRTYEKQSPERDIELFLSALSDEEKKDVIALFYFGQHAGDDFDYLREHSLLSLKEMPWFLADKRSLHDCLIEGLNRLGDSRV